MKLPLSSIPKTRIGTCPHGLPQGACPICSGMGGGGGSSARKTDEHTGEMSWDECYAIWQQMLKVKELSQQKKNEALKNPEFVQINFSAKLDSIAQKLVNFSEKLSDFVQKSKEQTAIPIKLASIFSKAAIPVLNALNNVTVLAQKIINFIQTKFADISEKLAAIFGELKNSVEKKISDKLKDFKKKIKSLFGLFENEKNLEVNITKEIEKDAFN